MKVQATDAAVARATELVGELDELTMYRLAAVLSEALGRRVREQQMYNYRKNGLIKGLVDGKASREVAIAFVAKQLAKHS